MYLVSARKSTASITAGTKTAAEALQRSKELERDGFRVIVFNVEGRERTREELEAEAADERRALGKQAYKEG